MFRSSDSTSQRERSRLEGSAPAGQRANPGC
ncbi:hypothetical protein AVEN_214517-1, partial [Araneus ventricosus]